MARLDLKNCDIRIKDGTRDAGAVNNASGYAAGATTVAYDGTAADIPAGTLITFGTSKIRYKVSGVPTSTSVSFTPGLKAAVVDNAVINVIGKYIQLKIGDGTLTYSQKTPHEYLKERGKLDEVRLADEEPMDVTVSGVIEYLTGHTGDPGGGLPSISDVFNKTGLASGWISSDLVDPCKPYCLDIEVDHKPLCDNVYAELVEFLQFRPDNLDGDLKAATFNIPGKCNILKPTFTRYDQTP